MCFNIIRRNNRPRPTHLAPVALALVASAVFAASAHADVAATREMVVPNDNTRRAGSVDGSTVTVRLRAAKGTWHPEGPGGPALTVDAFGEQGSALTIPAPLIRVTEGASVAVTLSNELEAPIRVHGLCARQGERCAPVDVPPGEQREVRFEAVRPGTYHYWATSLGVPFPFRELAGALVVDPAGAAPQADRIFVITEWANLTAGQIRDLMAADDVDAKFVELGPRFVFVINGLSWPATERLTYRQGETVRWRVINLSSQVHPMHLHGFYFTVLGTGDGSKDEPTGGGKGRRVVTETVPSGGTLHMEWTPEREGNWLFHCHIMHHVSPGRRLDQPAATTNGHAAHHPQHGTAHDPGLGMAGMVLGITITPAGAAPVDAPAAPASPRRLTMTIAPERETGGTAVAFTEPGTDAPADNRPQSPGPVLVLRCGEPVEIAVENRLAEPTSIHWHGLELESYYDGAHGWSGVGTRTAPMIEPGQSFVVRLAPPRAGTFIYHTHLHDYRQLTSGLYGALVVTEPGERFDPETDHVIVLGRHNATEITGILQDPSSLVVNGTRSPRWRWMAARRHRIRLVNITPDEVLSVSLLKGEAPATWRPAAKDGTALSAEGGRDVPAMVRIAVGETYDFEYEAPPGRGRLWLDVRTTSGKWQAQGEVLLR